MTCSNCHTLYVYVGLSHRFVFALFEVEVRIQCEGTKDLHAHLDTC
jgi:hypothetical protein